MKLNKKMLKEIIREALNELEQAAPAAPQVPDEEEELPAEPSDVARIKDLMVRTKITDQIAKLINTPQELLALLSVLIQLPVQLDPQQKTTAMRATMGKLSTGEE